jgi:Putative zinc-finger
VSTGNNMPGRERPSGPTPLTHAEAEALISARLDGPLDPVSNRNLLAHLVGCHACRAFAERMETMARGLREMPHLPPSPTVSRQVRERVERGQSFWDRLSTAITSGRFGVAPAAAGTIALLAVLGFLVVTQFNRDNNGNLSPTRTTITAGSTGSATTQPTAAPTETATESQAQVLQTTDTPFAPTETATIVNITVPETATATDTVEPTETSTPKVIYTVTSQPTETETATEEATSTATATDSVVPDTETPTLEPTETATTKPSATATTKPTKTPEPTDTATAEPTETARPTETATPEPTETTELTETATPEATDTVEPTSTPTARPINTPRPTATTEATDTAEPTETATAEPTETDTPRPTKTPKPKPTRTPKPTKTPEPTETPTQPGIVPIGGGETQPAEVPTDTPVVEQPTEVPQIEPTSSGIEPSSTTPVVEDTETPEVQVEETPTVEVVSTEADLSTSQVLVDLPAGASAPSGPLEVTNASDGQFAVIFSGDQLAVVDLSSGRVTPIGPGASPMWSPLGFELLFASSPTTVSTWDRPTGAINRMTASDEGQTTDVPAGWIGEHLYYLRSFNDQPGHAELHQAQWDGSEDTVIWTGDNVNLTADHAVANDTDYQKGILIPTDTGWFLITPDGTESKLGDNPFEAIGDATVSPGGSRIAYTANGELIVASTTAPGSPLFTLTYPDGGFAFSPDGMKIVTAGSDGLFVFNSNDGSSLSSVVNAEGMHASSPYWSDSGVTFIDVGAQPPVMRLQPMS